MDGDTRSVAAETYRHSWRELHPVHPCAAVYPMLSDAKIDELAKDIQQHGLREPVKLYVVAGSAQVLDGRNRLEALARNGINFGDPSSYPFQIFETVSGEIDPAAFVISANNHRRHLTKLEQAESIVRATEAGRASTDGATSARSVKRAANGRVTGSTKDPIKATQVREAAKVGISERMVKHARAKVQGKTQAPRKVKAAAKPVTPTAPVLAQKLTELLLTFLREMEARFGKPKTMAVLREIVTHPQSAWHLKGA